MALFHLSCNRSDWDRSRSERLAQLRIEERAGKAVQKTPQDLPDKHFLEQLQFVDLQVELVREVTKKHFYEREVEISFLYNLSVEFKKLS